MSGLRDKQEIFVYKKLTDVIICIKGKEIKIFAQACELASEDDKIRIKQTFKRGYKLRFNLTQPKNEFKQPLGWRRYIESLIKSKR